MARPKRFDAQWALRGTAAAAALTFAPPASAAISLIEKEITREGVEIRDSNRLPFAISRSDCEENALLVFPVAIHSAPSAVIEVWSVEGNSIDCRLGSNRAGAAPPCQLLASVDALDAENGFLELRIDAQAIAGSLETIEGCVDTQHEITQHEVTLFFLELIDPAEDVPDYRAKEWDQTDVLLVGPRPPTDVTAEPSEQGSDALRLEWDQNGGFEVEGHHVYCVPASVGSGSPGCASESLRPGEVPTLEPGAIVGNTDNGTVAGLVTGQTFACGVATLDILGNVGVLPSLPAPPRSRRTTSRATKTTRRAATSRDAATRAARPRSPLPRSRQHCS